MRSFKAAFAATCLLVPALCAAQDVSLSRAYSHNDYLQARPLVEALERDFGAVEADIWLEDGKLLVAHTKGATDPSKTLQSLYLDPLAARVAANGGHVYGDGRPLLLLLDVKSDAEPTYEAISQVLAKYAAMLTRFSGGAVREGAITVVISGNRARQTIAAQAVRYAGIDGDASDLDSDAPASLVPMISIPWWQHFLWWGFGPFPGSERARLEGMVRKAHARGRKIRFYTGPDFETAWDIQYDEGVDYINTDHLEGLAHFLLARRPVDRNIAAQDASVPTLTAEHPALERLEAAAAGSPWN